MKQFMKKVKEVYKFVGEKLENPRTRAITILGLYLIFFVLVALLIDAGQKDGAKEQNGPVEKDIVNYQSIMEEYEFSYDIEFKEEEKVEKYTVTGKISVLEKNELIKKYNDEIDDYEITEDTGVINKDFLLLDKVISLVNNREVEYETNYKDGTVLKNFKVPITEFNVNYEEGLDIEISVYELSNGNIGKIIIDSTNLDKKQNDLLKSVVYTLEYRPVK